MSLFAGTPNLLPWIFAPQQWPEGESGVSSLSSGLMAGLDTKEEEEEEGEYGKASGGGGPGYGQWTSQRLGTKKVGVHGNIDKVINIAKMGLF